MFKDDSNVNMVMCFMTCFSRRSGWSGTGKYFKSPTGVFCTYKNICRVLKWRICTLYFSWLSRDAATKLPTHNVQQA